MPARAAVSVDPDVGGERAPLRQLRDPVGDVLGGRLARAGERRGEAEDVERSAVVRRLDAVDSRSLTRDRERRYHPITQFADPPWLEYDTVTTPGRTTPCRTTS